MSKIHRNRAHTHMQWKQTTAAIFIEIENRCMSEAITLTSCAIQMHANLIYMSTQHVK